MSESLDTVVSMLQEMRSETAAYHAETHAKLTDLDMRLTELLADMCAMMQDRSAK